MRHVTGLAVLVLLLSCPSGASSQQIPLLAAPPPPNTVDWSNYTVTSGADAKVSQYLGSIDALVNIMAPPNGTQIKGATQELRTHLFAGHNDAQTWARIMLAYRFAARGSWTGCLRELETAPRNKTPPANWLNFTKNPHGGKVQTLLTLIRTKNNSRPPPNGVPDIAAVDQSILAREQGPNKEHELIEGWNRILLASYIAEGAGDTDAEWSRVKDELDHLEPSR